jgi:Protein of unknown function (DUF3592)
MPQPTALENQLKALRQILFMGAGVVLVGGSLVSIATVYHFTQTAVAVPGVVTKLNYGGSHPEIKFTMQTGETVEYSQNGFIFGYQPGDAVRVLYQPGEPRSAMVDTFGAKWGFPLMFLVMGLGFAGMSWLDKRGLIDLDYFQDK